MSAADLFVDGFPHGTPQGFTDGCKSGACPGKADFGMSCRMAWQAERSDRRYRRLADEGMPPAGIALELGLVEPEQMSSSAAASLVAWRVSKLGVPAMEAAEALVAGAGAPVLAADVMHDLSRPARIRAWAREQGMTVGEVGPIRRAVIEAYDARDIAPAAPAEEAPSAEPEPDAEPNAETVDDEPETEPTMPSCSRHPNGTDAPCAACGRARRAHRAEGLVPEHIQHTPRPDFGQAMVDVDVERARRIAVHLEQLLAETERQRDEALADVHTLTTALAHEQQVSKFAVAEAAVLRRSIADARARRGRGLGGFVRRMVTR